jgi:uncharacterized protein with HEPN domain
MWRDDSLLLDILIAARKIAQFTEDMTWVEFAKDSMCQNAVMYNIQIIGEAARNVSEETKTAHPDIPWHEIVGMRHRLVHDYMRIDLAKVWDTIEEDIPPLIEALGPLVPPDEGE